MRRNLCDRVRSDLDAFLDGELSGSARLRVAQHLDQCADCRSTLESLRSVGDTLRAEMLGGPSGPGRLMAPRGVLGDDHLLDGLAGTVVSRIRAESAHSWRSLALRGVADWHWAIVGAGSIAATFVSTSLLSVILAFGPGPQRDDSLASIIGHLEPPPALLFVYATSEGDERDSMLLQVDNGQPVASRMSAALVTPALYQPPGEAELVSALAAASVSRDGRLMELDAVTPAGRKYIEGLLDEITQVRLTEPASVGLALNVREVRLVTSTSVTAKGG